MSFLFRLQLQNVKQKTTQNNIENVTAKITVTLAVVEVSDRMLLCRDVGDGVGA
jgi:hypothetical protein